jgi:hypothetical protein
MYREKIYVSFSLAKYKLADDMDSLFRKNDERFELVRSIITSVLSDDISPAWSSMNLWYYTRLSKHIASTDQDIVDDIEVLATKLRAKYRTFHEYQHNMFSVPLERQGSCFDGDCALCLKSLESSRRIARLRPANDDPATCGHVFHLECATQIKPDDSNCIRCPLCRAAIGPYIRCWLDTENSVPKY